LSGFKKKLKQLSKNRKELIERNISIPIKRQAELLDIQRSTIYYQKKESKEDKHLMDLIDKIYTKTPFYGQRRIKKELKIKYQLIVSRKKIRRLMREMSLEAVYPKKRTTQKNKEHKTYPNIVKRMIINQPNQVWATDITYIRLKDRYCYLVVIMDWYSRYVIDWKLSTSLDSSFCKEALQQALAKNTPNIFHSDQGCQFTAEGFISILKQKEIKISMSSKGRYYDNIFVERLWRTVKYENVYLNNYETIEQAKEGLEEYFHFYNNERFHSSLEDKTPRETYFVNKKSLKLKLRTNHLKYLENVS